MIKRDTDTAAWTLFMDQLIEAHDHLGDLIEKLAIDHDYDESSFRVDMSTWRPTSIEHGRPATFRETSLRRNGRDFATTAVIYLRRLTADRTDHDDGR
jgi:hypothetical protein